MIIRPYSAQDAPQAIQLWNATLTEDKLNQENFYTRIICDAAFDPALYLLAEDAGELVGFIYGTHNGTKGWIIAMGARDPRQGIGRALVDTLTTKLKALGITQVDVGNYAGHYFFPGVDRKNYAGAIEFFTALGFEDTGMCASMDMNLRQYRTPEKYLAKQQTLESQGYTFAPYCWEDSLALFAFFQTHFPYWADIARTNILRGDGGETIQLAKDPTGQVVGFAMRAMDGTPGRFGPFGVASTQQGTGLGGILFHRLIRDMVERRIFYTWFLWTGGRNLDIYGAWGMHQYRSYTVFSKTL